MKNLNPNDHVRYCLDCGQSGDIPREYNEKKKMTKLKIEKMYAYIAIEPNGNEGITAVLIDDMWCPLVGADKERLEALRPYAQGLSAHHGDIVLAEFSVRKDLEIIKAPSLLES